MLSIEINESMPTVETAQLTTPYFLDYTEKSHLYLNDTKYFQFLESKGFRTVRFYDDIKLVRIQGNIIKKIIPYDIKKFVIEHALGFNNSAVMNYIYNNRKMFTPDYLNALKEETPLIARDTHDMASYFYKNGIVNVTKDGISAPIPYEESGKLIWEHHIIPRNFIKKPEDLTSSVFIRFLYDLADNNERRLIYISSIIGYALHNYRTNANTRAIIFSDENICDQPEGGSGKSLLVKALGHFRNLVIKDGKSFNPRKNFEWSDVDESTDLVLLDDIHENFNFEDLFSVISEGFTTERKFENKVRLPIEKSPLILITTNRLITGNSGSFKRRQYNVDIHQHFNHSFTPIDKYGHTFFTDWDELEWAKFDWCLLSCVQFYLANNITQIPESDQKMKNAIRATDETFYEWFEEVKYDFQYYTSTNSAMDRFIEETGQKGMKLSAKKFLSQIKACCAIFGYTFIDERTSSERGFRLNLITSLN